MAARGRLKAVTFPPASPLSDLQFELGRIQAAHWLIDQIQVGELSFLANPGTYPVNCWMSFLSLSTEALADHLRHMAYREVADALKAAEAALQAAAGAPVSQPEAP